jgi:predicted transcriptional regulator
MNETLSIRIDPKTKKRLDALSKRSKRSKSFLAAEAIAAYVDSEEWQFGEVQAGIAELDSGQEVSHKKVAKWLKSWGKPSETKPRDDDRMIPPGVAPLGIHSPTHRKGLRTECSSRRKPNSRGSRTSPKPSGNRQAWPRGRNARACGAPKPLSHPIPGPSEAAGTNCSLPRPPEVAAEAIGLSTASSCPVLASTTASRVCPPRPDGTAGT